MEIEALVPRLTAELKDLLVSLLQAAKTNVVFNKPAELESVLNSVTEDQVLDLEIEFDHLDVRSTLSTPDSFMEVLKSFALAPIQYVSPEFFLRECLETKINTHLISDLLVDDLISRLTNYLSCTPTLVRIGIYQAWLRCDPWAPKAETLAEAIRASGAPLLQKLTQMIGEASAAKDELQVVKDRIEPMTEVELAQVLEDAYVTHLFKSFEENSIAAGSIGQGHQAVLKSTGQQVFVKVKRLGIASLMQEEARIFNLSTIYSSHAGAVREESPWADLATELIKETSFSQELRNQQRLRAQWDNISPFLEVVDILAALPKRHPTVLIMKDAIGTTIGNASIRFPLGLENAVEAFNALIHHFYAQTLFYTPSQDTRHRSTRTKSQELADTLAQAVSSPDLDLDDMKTVGDSFHVNSSIKEVAIEDSDQRQYSVSLYDEDRETSQAHLDAGSDSDSEDEDDVAAEDSEYRGYAPADPHSANFHISCCNYTGSVTITVLDTASLCFITRAQRTKVINLLICISMGDVDGLCKNLDIIHDEGMGGVEYTKARFIFKRILSEDPDDAAASPEGPLQRHATTSSPYRYSTSSYPQSDTRSSPSVSSFSTASYSSHSASSTSYPSTISTPYRPHNAPAPTAAQGMDQWVLKTLIRVIEATKLILKRRALNEILVFGKAQLQLLDTVSVFTRSHGHELRQLGLAIDSPMTVFKNLLVGTWQGQNQKRGKNQSQNQSQNQGRGLPGGSARASLIVPDAHGRRETSVTNTAPNSATPFSTTGTTSSNTTTNNNTASTSSTTSTTTESRDILKTVLMSASASSARKVFSFTPWDTSDSAL